MKCCPDEYIEKLVEKENRKGGENEFPWPADIYGYGAVKDDSIEPF